MVRRKQFCRVVSACVIDANIDFAFTTEDAIALAKTTHYDVVFINYRMASFSGIELMLKLQNDCSMNHANTVVMLDRPDKSLKFECLKAGAVEVLIKSDINKQNLTDVIESVGARLHVLTQKNGNNVVAIDSARDALTQTLSRAEFEQSIRETIGINDNKNAAIILTNINNFRSVNELFGIEIGDKILQIIAKRMSFVAKAMTSFARVGGDEFALLVENYNTAHHLRVISDNILEIINRPIWLDDQQISISASVGVSTFPLDADNEEELYRYAFIALYRAKQLGRNQISFFEHTMQETVLRKHQIELAIKRVIAKDKFHMVFQPIFDGKTNALLGAEALIRWPDEKPIFYPDEFIPASEASGDIIKVGEFAIKESLKEIKQWRDALSSDLTVNVNVSSKQLVDKSLASFIKAQLTELDLPASCLTLELTETALIDGGQNTVDMLLALKSLGCSIALDDFGTGFSSISHLLNFPIDIVKIDKSVLPSSDDEYKQHAVTTGLVLMLKQLSCQIVIEGIETEYQHKLVQSLNVDKVQGYYYARPQSADLMVNDHILPRNKKLQ